MCLGLVLTGLLLYLLQKPLDSVLESQYQGWEQFAGITLGVPIALSPGLNSLWRWMLFVISISERTCLS